MGSYRMYNSLPKAVTFFLSKGLTLILASVVDILTFTEESWLFGYERFSVWVNNYLDKSKFNIFIRFAVAPDNVGLAVHFHVGTQPQLLQPFSGGAEADSAAFHQHRRQVGACPQRRGYLEHQVGALHASRLH